MDARPGAQMDVCSQIKEPHVAWTCARHATTGPASLVCQPSLLLGGTYSVPHSLEIDRIRFPEARPAATVVQAELQQPAGNRRDGRVDK